jgi:lysophospholipase L1-like esterase
MRSLRRNVVPFVLAVSLVCLAVAALAPVAARADAAATTIRVMPLGDSITDGFVVAGGYRTQLWTRTVQTDGDAIDYVGSLTSGPANLGDQNHEGHTGWCIDGLPCGKANDMLAFIDGWLTKAQPNIILLHAGTNDINDGFTGAQTAAHMDALLGKIFTDEPTVDVIVAKIIPMAVTGTKLQAWTDFDAAIPGLVSKYAALGDNLHMVDMSTLLMVRTTDYYQSSPTAGFDSLHPSLTGYQKIADAWYPALTADYQSLEGSATPSPTVDPTATPTVDPTATPTTDPTADPTPTDTPSPTLSPTPSPTPTPSPSPTPSPTPTITPALVKYFGGCDMSVEKSASCWTGVYNATSKVTWIATDGQSGTHSIRLTSPTSTSAAAGLNAKPSPVTSTSPGVAFTAGVWVRASAPNITISLLLRERRANNTAPGYALASWKATDTKWHFLTVGYTTKEKGNSLSYSVYAASLPKSAYVDADVFSLTSVLSGA